MEKEQKKLLLVAVSVGVFLLVTITAAIAILAPKANMQETAYTQIQQYPSGGLKPATVGNDIQQPASTTQETGKVESPVAAVDVKENDRNVNVIKLDKPTAVAVPDNQETLPTTRSVAAVAPAAKPAAVKPAVKKETASAVKPAAAAKTKTVNDYWVQTGAFIAKVRAEDTRELLASKGITSIIENREINGKTWYRVRVGPYTSENEAKYWLSLVQTIGGFEKSEVRQTVR